MEKVTISGLQPPSPDNSDTDLTVIRPNGSTRDTQGSMLTPFSPAARPSPAAAQSSPVDTLASPSSAVSPAPGTVTPAAEGNPSPRVRHGAAVPGHRDAAKTFADGPIQRVPPDQGLASQRAHLQKHEDDLPPWVRITPYGLVCDFCRAAKNVVSAPGPSVDKNTAWINGELTALLGSSPRFPCPPFPLSVRRA